MTLMVSASRTKVKEYGAVASCEIPDTPPPPITFTQYQVEMQMRRLHSGKSAGPDGVSPPVLKACAPQLCGVFHKLFMLSLQRVPVMWKTSCLVPIPKTPRPSGPQDYRPVALTSHIMKTLERLILDQLRSIVRPHLDPLQFAYQPRLRTEDAIIYLLNRVYTHQDQPANMFFDFSMRGMIIVQSAGYRCGDKAICPQSDTLDNVRNSCDGKTVCDIKSNITYDPGVCRYLETTYACFTHHSVTCEGSQSNLQCGEGQVIVVSWANYGRRDTTTCPDGRPDSQLQNVNCSWSTSMEYFTKMCNWQNSCTVKAPSSVDPCRGTYEYLEVFFTCQDASCPPGWTWFGGRCFIFKSSMKNWPDAERSCETLGGHLASFHSTAEYTFIRELTHTAAGLYETAWVGGNDRETKCWWMWSDGSQFDFPNWAKGEPNDAGGREDCMMINYGGRDYVNDAGCNANKPFVCVRDP
ncbi:unnamed protein product [Oreochromis niloticus]|nr:unnamed protein product [Mustela putorius furo]